jgi:hypothetical protein
MRHVAVPDVNPKGARVFQDTTASFKHFDKMLNVLVWGCFPAKLALPAIPPSDSLTGIVPKLPIWGAGADAVHGSVWKGLQGFCSG